MNEYPTASSKWKMRIKALFEESNVVICLSKSWRNAILEIAPYSNIEVLPNSIRLPELGYLDKKAENNIQLTFLGLIGERKGVFDLLIVLKRLIDNGYDLKLRIGGNGAVERLLKEIDSLDIGHRVQYLGWISEKERDYVVAARVMGKSPFAILFREILPNSIYPVIIDAVMRMGTTIIALAGLSFIGVGVQPPNPDWGIMISSGRKYLLDYPMLSILPGILIIIVVLAYNMIGDRLRDALDPKLRRELVGIAEA